MEDLFHKVDGIGGFCGGDGRFYWFGLDVSGVSNLTADLRKETGQNVSAVFLPPMNKTNRGWRKRYRDCKFRI